MRAIQITEYLDVATSPSLLRATTLPTPGADPDLYTVAVHAAAANFFDILQLAGKYQSQPPFPWTAGAEFAGTVLHAPTSAAKPAQFPAGTLVFGSAQGAFATHARARAAQLRRAPAGWTAAQAAGLFVTAPTAWAALAVRAGVRPGETVLVHAAAGGVGLAAVQVARALGATVVATAGSEKKLAVARRFGAQHGVLYGDDGWPERVRRITGGRGVDVVFDPVGLVEKSSKCVAWNGRIVVIGFVGGEIERVAMNRVLLKNISIVGLFWGRYASEEPGTMEEVWRALERLIAEGKFRPTVYTDAEYVGLESVGRALQALGARKTWGKVVIGIPEDSKSRI
jgi:NADPH2:quinone reductase